jgi:putative DNA primase/helicase
MFCLSSIGVGADKQADKTRFTVCQLRHGGMTKNEWNEYLKKIHELITPEWAARLRARTATMLPIIKKNAETFSLAISEMVSSSRAGDQHGTLLAGCFSLTSDKLIDFEAARQWVIAKDWAEVKETHDSADEKSCCDTIMQSTIRLRGGDISISELILEVGKATPDQNVADARDALARNGIKIEGFEITDYKILIADSHPMIKNILGHTAWWKTYGRTLKRIVGSETRGASKFHGICCRATAIPWDKVFIAGDGD